MNKAIIPLLCGLFLAVGVMVGTQLKYGDEKLNLLEISSIDNSSNIKSNGRVEEIISLLDNSYVDSVQEEKIVISAIDHLLSELDPYTGYISQDEYSDYQNIMSGKYAGIGIESLFFEDTMHVVHVKEASTKKYLKPGDKVIEINGENITGQEWNFKTVRKLINQNVNKELSLLILRNKEIIDIPTLIVQDLEYANSNVYFPINDTIGYIKMNRFSENTYQQFMFSIEKLMEGKDKIDLVLDLRDNPGGYLPQSLKILSQIFDKKDMILTFTEGLHRQKKEYKSTGRNFFKIDNIIVLINENSASASEIVAGAIQDWDRGLIVGNNSYGKGLVQEIFTLKNKDALRITVARYFTPSGRQIQNPYIIENDTLSQVDSVFYSFKYKRQLNNNGGIEPDYQIEDQTLACDIDYYTIQKFVVQDWFPSNPDISSNNIERALDLYEQNNGTLGNSFCDITAKNYLEFYMYYCAYGQSKAIELTQDDDAYIIKATELLTQENIFADLLPEEF